MAYSCEPPRLTVKNLPGTIERITFGVFTFGPSSSLTDKQVVANSEFGGGYCQRLGVWYPKSRLMVDGIGRTVGDDQWSEKPKGDEWL